MRATSVIARTLVWVSLSFLTGWELRKSLPDPRAALAEAGIRLLEGNVYRVVGSHRAILDVYLPTSRSRPEGRPPGRPAVLAIHGGSWRGGSRFDYRSDPNSTVVRLARHGLVVIAVDYRLASPRYPSWPHVIEDLREAVRWTRRHASELEIQPDWVAVFGQSSGAHLAALLGTLPDEPGIDGVSSRVQAVVSLYGPTDLEHLMGARHVKHEPARILLGTETPTSAGRGFASRRSCNEKMMLPCSCCTARTTPGSAPSNRREWPKH